MTLEAIAPSALSTVTGGTTIGDVLGPAGAIVDRSLPIQIGAGPRRPPQGDGIPLPAHVWGAPNR